MLQCVLECCQTAVASLGLLMYSLRRVGLEECRSTLVSMARVQAPNETTFENQFATLIRPRVEYIYVSVADNHPPPQVRVGGKQGHARRGKSR